MRVHLRLKSHLSELERLAGTITQLGAAHDLPEKVVSELNLALEEVVSNIIRHGYEGQEDRDVSIVFHLAPEAIAVTVEDDGMPFNPLQLPDPDLTIPLEERRVGGLGVYLVRQLMDEVNYRAEGGRNILRLTKRITPRRPGTETAGADEREGGSARQSGWQLTEEANVPLTVTSKEREVGVVIVCPAGSLDSNTYSTLEDRLSGIRKSGPRVIIFDLKDLTYISSAGVRVFLALRKAMKTTGGTVALTNLQPQIRKVFDIIQALPSLNVFENIEELDRYLAAMQRKVQQGEGK